MLKDLKFVAGAINKKDIVQALSHFRIKNQTVSGYNGVIGLSSPVALDLDVTPNAAQLVKAVAACEDTIALHVTPKGKLSIKSGKFKCLVDCIDPIEYPEILPQGETVMLDGKFLPAIKALTPFVSEDASRIWSRGILFQGASAYATNNISLVEYWLGYNFPVTVVVPKTALNELIRINEEPTHLQVSENRITFHFSGNRWLSSQTYLNDWPSSIGQLLKVDAPNYLDINEEFVTALETLLPFTAENKTVVFNPSGTISTSESEDEGTSIDTSFVDFKAVFDCAQLLLITGIANQLAIKDWPGRCAFKGSRIRGVTMGQKGNSANED